MLCFYAVYQSCKTAASAVSVFNHGTFWYLICISSKTVAADQQQLMIFHIHYINTTIFITLHFGNLYLNSLFTNYQLPPFFTAYFIT